VYVTQLNDEISCVAFNRLQMLRLNLHCLWDIPELQLHIYKHLVLASNLQYEDCTLKSCSTVKAKETSSTPAPRCSYSHSHTHTHTHTHTQTHRYTHMHMHTHIRTRSACTPHPRPPLQLVQPEGKDLPNAPAAAAARNA